MKRSVLIILLLLAFPVISAASIDMKSSYDQGETIIAKVDANFYDELTEENVFFYRGHVSIPMDYDVGKVGDYYYIKGSLIGKTRDNYSIKIKDAHYYKQGFLTDEEIVKNFTITNATADFAVNPGFIVSIGNFSIEVTNLQDFSIDLNIDTPSKINSQSPIDVPSGLIKNLDFDTSEMEEDISSIVKIKTSSLTYEIPIYVYYQSPEQFCGDGVLNSGEQCDGEVWGSIAGCEDFGYDSGTLSCKNPGTFRECTFDLRNCFNVSDECDNDEDCENDEECVDGRCVDEEEPYCGDDKIDSGEQCDGHNWGTVDDCGDFGFNKGTLRCVDCLFDTSSCYDGDECDDDDDCDNDYKCVDGECEECEYDRDCDDDEECKNNRCVDKDEEECERKTEKKDCDLGYICENNECVKGCRDDTYCKTDYTCVKEECVSDETSTTCKDKGGDICSSNEICEGSYQEIRGYICCLDAQCKEKEEDPSGKIIGWALLVIVILALVFFYIRYKKVKKNRVSPKKIGLKRF